MAPRAGRVFKLEVQTRDVENMLSVCEGQLMANISRGSDLISYFLALRSCSRSLGEAEAKPRLRWSCAGRCERCSRDTVQARLRNAKADGTKVATGATTIHNCGSSDH